MFSIFKFIFKCVIDFASMLFTIQVDNGLSLGLLLCLTFIFLPMMLRIVRFLKQDALEELDDKYDETRPMQTITSSYHERTNLGGGRSYRYTNNVTRRRRMK